MGGMFTILKVRDELPADGSDPGWFKDPPGTVATVADAGEMQRDGIDPDMPAHAGQPSGKASNAGKVKSSHAH